MQDLPPLLVAEDDDDDFFFLRRAVRPVQAYNQCSGGPGGGGSCGPGFIGAIGLRASAAGISEVGRIQHPTQQQQQQQCSVPPAQPGQSSPPQPSCEDRPYSVTPPIERSVVIGSHLFTFSQQGMLSSDLTSLAQQAWVPYPQG